MIKAAIVVAAVLSSAVVIVAYRPEPRECYPFDSKNVPGDYVLRGDGWWCPHP